MDDSAPGAMMLRLMNAPDGRWPTPIGLGDHTCTIDYDGHAGRRFRTVTMHRARQGVASVMIEATCHMNGPGRVFRLDHIRSIIDPGGNAHDPIGYFTRTFGVSVASTAGPTAAPRPVGPFTGHGVTFTGEFEHISRAETRQIVESAGGICFGTVQDGVTILVVGTAPSPRKIAAAKKASISVIGEAEFVAMAEKD